MTVPLHYQGPQITTLGTKTVVGAAVQLTRPNNVTAYAAGQVYGTAADGRITIASPALPADAALTAFNNMSLLLVQGNVPTAAAIAVNLILFSAVPATVLADQAGLALSDADIALILTQLGGVAFSFSSATGTQVLNMSAGNAGRRGVLAANIVNVVTTLAPSSNYGIYLVVGAAYTPVALETMTVIPYWHYQVAQR